MNRREVLLVLKNSAANVFRGASAAMVALILPPFLTSDMSKDAFAAWSLVLQVSAYVGYLDFGVQTAVGRFVARAQELNDVQLRDRIVSTALYWLSWIAGATLFVACIVAVFMQQIFPDMPPEFVSQSRYALLFVGGSLAVTLPATVFSAIFVGVQRTQVPATVIASSRIASALAMIWLVRHGYSIVAMAIATAVCNLAGAIIQWILVRRDFPELSIRRSLVDRASTKELFDYCKTFSIWNFAMFLVTGLDLSIVGIFRYQEVPYYSVANSLVIFLIGLQNAIFSAFVPSAAAMHARGDAKSLGKVLIVSSRYSAYMLLMLGLPLIAFAYGIVVLWLGADYASMAAPMLQVLVIANIVRLSTSPFIAILVGSGQQHLAVPPALIEGAVNLLASIVGAYLWGGMGVAVGTVVGAVAGLLAHLFYDMPRTTEVLFTVRQYVREAIMRPAICFLPIIAAVTLVYSGLAPHNHLVTIAVMAVLLTVVLITIWGKVRMPSTMEGV